MPNENDEAPPTKGPPESLTGGMHFPKRRSALTPRIHNLVAPERVVWMACFSPDPEGCHGSPNPDPN